MAKDFYDLRSMIAHGGNTGDRSFRVGEERLKLHEAASRTKGALRKIIKHFLPHAGSAPYKKREFWERAYFGILDSQAKSAGSP